MTFDQVLDLPGRSSEGIGELLRLVAQRAGQNVSSPRTTPSPALPLTPSNNVDRTAIFGSAPIMDPISMTKDTGFRIGNAGNGPDAE
jgi:hypothetical protein